MKDICKHLNIDTKKYKEKTFLNAISSAKNELQTPDEYAAEVAKEYNKKILKIKRDSTKGLITEAFSPEEIKNIYQISR